MNKADLERLLKRCTGAALKPVLVMDEYGKFSTPTEAYYDNDLGCVIVRVVRYSRGQD